jgi:hypothetical protein
MVNVLGNVKSDIKYVINRTTSRSSGVCVNGIGPGAKVGMEMKREAFR